ncbi:hypothetical protein TNCV_2954551 [Trichonephila clavipes]|nr:hypothetical protein TNCV_2954551 [Trichonephila clavipes]
MVHIIRMPDDNVVKKVLQFKVTGIRKGGRPRLRWVDSVQSEFGIINEKTWRTKVTKSINFRISVINTNNTKCNNIHWYVNVTQDKNRKYRSTDNGALSPCTRFRKRFKISKKQKYKRVLAEIRSKHFQDELKETCIDCEKREAEKLGKCLKSEIFYLPQAAMR